MNRVAFANLRSNPIRLASTALAIVLSIAFITGMLVLTDTIGALFDDAFGGSGALDVSVRGQDSFDTEAQRAPVDPAIAAEVEQVAGVAAVEATYSGPVAFAGPDGQPVEAAQGSGPGGGGGAGASSTGADAPTVTELAAVELREGRYPATPAEVALETAAAQERSVAVGDEIALTAGTTTSSYAVVGLIGGLDGEDTFGGAIAVFDDATAAALLGPDGAQSLSVLADEGVDREVLRDDVAAALSGRYDVVTGDELATESTAGFATVFSYITYALLGFAGVSLLVGAFIIYNTFSILVTQRTRELALLRAVGAGRGQVLWSVLLEAAVVGVLASVVGVAAGVGLAAGTLWVLELFGFSLPGVSLVVTATALVVGPVLGVVVTAVSALIPALGATRIAPVAALRTADVQPTVRMSATRVGGGAAVLAAGAGALAWGAVGSGGLWAAGGGALAVLLAVAALTPLAVGPVIGLLGAPIAATRGLQGVLARENALRNPSRTATTSAALMIGLGLVCFTLIFASSLTASVDASIDEEFLADLQVLAPQTDAAVAALPDGALEAAGEVSGVALAAPSRIAALGIDGVSRSVAALDPANVGRTVALDVVDGSLDDLGAGVAVQSDLATDLGVAVGDTLELTYTPAGTAAPVTVVALVEQGGIGFGGAAQLWLGDDAFAEAFPDVAPSAADLVLADGADVAQVRGEVETALAGYPGLTVLDTADLSADVASAIDTILILVGGLLGLSILIALFGIVNTLTLSVLERTREIGLLRAVGMARAQVRSMIRWESVLVAVLGAVLGAAVGALFGWIGVLALSDLGLSTFSLPAVQLALAFVAAAAAGVLAAILPARRGSRIDILDALEV